MKRVRALPLPLQTMPDCSTHNLRQHSCPEARLCVQAVSGLFCFLSLGLKPTPNIHDKFHFAQDTRIEARLRILLPL